MLKPVDMLVYLYYKCPSCKQVGDEVRLSEVLKKRKMFFCHSCGHEEEIAPICNIQTIHVDSQRVLDNKRVILTKEDINHVVKLMVSSGYSKQEAQEYIDRVCTNNNGITNVSDLFKYAVMEHEKTLCDQHT